MGLNSRHMHKTSYTNWTTDRWAKLPRSVVQLVKDVMKRMRKKGVYDQTFRHGYQSVRYPGTWVPGYPVQVAWVSRFRVPGYQPEGHGTRNSDTHMQSSWIQWLSLLVLRVYYFGDGLSPVPFWIPPPSPPINFRVKPPNSRIPPLRWITKVYL